MTEREKLVEELKRLEPSRRARAIHLRRDNAGLALAVERLRKIAEASRGGHIDATGLGLRVHTAQQGRR